jgi:hypothetical protein
METAEFRKLIFRNGVRLSILLALLSGIAILGSGGGDEDIQQLLSDSQNRHLPLNLTPANIDLVLTWSEQHSTPSDTNPLHIMYSPPDRNEREDLFLGSNVSEPSRQQVLELALHRRGVVDFYWTTPCINDGDKSYEMLAAIANEPNDTGVIVNAGVTPNSDNGLKMNIIELSNYFDESGFYSSTGHGDAVPISEEFYRRSVNNCLGYTIEP